MKHSVTLPLRLPSVANKRMHWGAKAKLVSSQREATQLALDAAATARALPMLVVTLTRVAPRALDGDNLQAAFKAVRDQVAAHFRTADNNPCIEWRYAQEKGAVGVRIDLEVVAPSLRLTFEGYQAVKAEYALADALGMGLVEARASIFVPPVEPPKKPALRVASERPVTTLRDLALMATSSVVRNRR